DLGIGAAIETPEEPSASVGPIAISRSGRNSEQLGRIVNCHAGKEMQLHELRSLCIMLGEFVQGFMDRHDLRIVAFKRDKILGQFHLPPTPSALASLLPPGLLNQDTAHGLGGGRKKMTPVGK